MTITIIIAQMCMSRGVLFFNAKKYQVSFEVIYPKYYTFAVLVPVGPSWQLQYSIFFIFSLQNKYKIRVSLYCSVRTKKLIKIEMRKVSILCLTPSTVLPFYVTAETEKKKKNKIKLAETVSLCFKSTLFCH